MEAYVRFIIPDEDLRTDGSNLTIVTTYDGQTVYDPNGLWFTALGATAPMETAMTGTLADMCAYPFPQAGAMSNATAWNNGLALLQTGQPEFMKLNMDYDTCRLLPELLPFANKYCDWLDGVAPIYRTLNIGQPSVERCKDVSLAIICQDGQDAMLMDENITFESLADDIAAQLLPVIPVVDVYRGSEFTYIPFDRNMLLYEIFHEHKAVLFLCHSNRNPNVPGGWQLTDDVYLSITELRAFLGQRHRSMGPPIPEVVFSIACSGAARDQMTRILYPLMFLNAGVKFYIGTWMDLIFRTHNRHSSLGTISQLITEFFALWAVKSNNAIQHLYQAKAVCKFDLLTSLFQIYTFAGEQGGEAAEREQPQATTVIAPESKRIVNKEVTEDAAETTVPHPEITMIDEPVEAIIPQTRSPIGAIVSSVSVGQQVGDYLLRAELWADPHSRTFFATHTANQQNYLVQILADEWQNQSGLRQNIQQALAKLQELSLSSGQLIPDAHEVLVINKETAVLAMDVLIYERPDDEQPDEWRTLHAQDLDVIGDDHFVNVMRWGAQIGYLLAELHSHGILHGNFDPGAIVFLNADGEPQVFIKDSWVRLVRSARMTNPRYAAPEEPKAQDGLDQRKYDCFGLGRILYEMTQGKPYDASSVQDVRSAIAQYAPEALKRVISWCISPSAKVRPGAEGVARRLNVAAQAGGTYVDDFGERFDVAVRSGQHLFAVIVEEVDDLIESLKRLTEIPPQKRVNLPQYALFVLVEGEGLIDMNLGKKIIPWTNADSIMRDMQVQQPQQPIQPPNLETVIAYNIGNVILNANFIRFQVSGRIPIMVMQPGSTQISSEVIWRLMKNVQADKSKDAPIIVLADNLMFIDPHIQRIFAITSFPPLSYAELYDHIISVADTVLPDDSADNVLSDDLAVELTVRLFPCTKRDAIMALRMCALQYGVIDERAIDIRDTRRERFFHEQPGIDYIPVSRLPPPEWLALPLEVGEAAIAWAENVWRFTAGEIPNPPPRRILISGAGGVGKTSLANFLALQIRNPIIRIDPNNMLQGHVGQSEGNLRTALQMANSLHQCVVLFDNIDRFIQDNNINDTSRSVRLRMTTMLLDYIDNLQSGVTVVMISQAPHLLPAQWRRRWEQHWYLPIPFGIQSLDYRAKIFGAVFRRFNLAHLGNQDSFMEMIARQTDPTLVNVISPMARITKRTDTLELRTGEDFVYWVQETIILHASSETDPATQEFWIDAVS